MDKADIFLREPFRPFPDLRKEDYCQARARGLSNLRAADEAGVDRSTGAVWAKKEEILLRIREIRQSTDGYTEVSAAYVLAELKLTIQKAREDGEYKAAVDGLKALHDIITKDKTGMRAAALGLSGARLVTQNDSTVRKALRDDLSKPDSPIDTAGEEMADEDA